MARVLLRNALLLDPEAPAPEAGSLLLEGDRIAARLAPGQDAGVADARVIDLAGQPLAPGFLDLHFHGPLAWAPPELIESSLHDAARDLLRHGTTGFLATSLAWSQPELESRMQRLGPLVGQAPGQAACLGIHLEGPWIHAGAAGAQPKEGIRPFEAAEGRSLLDRGEGDVCMVTLAPEVAGVEPLLAVLAQRGIVAALGHSLASAEQAEAAVERGARHVTHLFNAMGVLHQREPGLAGFALGEDRLTCDLICDGVHVHPSLVRVAARAKRDRLVLITDRVDPGPDATLGKRVLHDDGSAMRLADGRLAGSRATLDACAARFRRAAGATLLESVAACTLRPARVLGIEGQRGTLRVGARADLAVLAAEGQILEPSEDKILDPPEGQILETWLGGERVWCRDPETP